MYCRKLYRSTLPLFLGVVVCGCQAKDEFANAPKATAPVVGPAVAATVANNEKTPVAAKSATETPQPAAVAEFTPPFPDRLELFEPPKRAQGTIRQDAQNGETVELKGFVNVDQPRVVLSIDGVIALIPEGGEKYGVQVISIQPPSVVLQRGRDRWPATLE